MNPGSILVIVATTVALLGACGATLLRHADKRFVRPLVIIALLVLALVATFDILPESKRELTWSMFVASVGVGYGLFWLIGRHVAPICPACAICRVEGGPRRSSSSGLLFLAIVLSAHCFVDGLGMRTASTIDMSSALRVFVAVALHKLPEGFAVGTLLMTGARSVVTALAIATGIEISTLAGAIVSAYCMERSTVWPAIVLAHIGGTFLYSSINGLRDVLAPASLPEALWRRVVDRKKVVRLQIAVDSAPPSSRQDDTTCSAFSNAAKMLPTRQTNPVDW